RGAPEDGAGHRRTRRAIVAGQEVRAGLHTLLRARSPALSSAMDRRDHRSARRREGGKSGRAAGLSVIASAAKQSRAAKKTGLLRRFAPRNDGQDMASPSPLALQPKRALHHLDASPADMSG